MVLLRFYFQSSNWPNGRPVGSRAGVPMFAPCQIDRTAMGIAPTALVFRGFGMRNYFLETRIISSSSSLTIFQPSGELVKVNCSISSPENVFPFDSVVSHCLLKVAAARL